MFLAIAIYGASEFENMLSQILQKQHYQLFISQIAYWEYKKHQQKHNTLFLPHFYFLLNK